MCKFYKFLALVLLPVTSTGFSATLHDGKAGQDAAGQQLVVAHLDVFHWNYVDIYKEDLPGFWRFLNEGVRAEWVETVFPSNSYATWLQSVLDCTYPESNQLLGNHLFDRKETEQPQFFSLDHPRTTKLIKWSQGIESIWTTATRLGKRVFLRYWSRCEVPYKGILPGECEGYGGDYDIEDTKGLFNLTLQKLQEGFDLLIVPHDLYFQENAEFHCQRTLDSQPAKNLCTTFGV